MFAAERALATISASERAVGANGGGELGEAALDALRCSRGRWCALVDLGGVDGKGTDAVVLLP